MHETISEGNDIFCKAAEIQSEMLVNSMTTELKSETQSCFTNCKPKTQISNLSTTLYKDESNT